MPRSSVVHYIAPSAISIVPNANGSANDLAVFVARGAKIRVYAPGVEGLGVNPNTNSFREWTLTGRNRRLNGGSGPYTIYARLQKSEVYVTDNSAYLVFAAQSQYGEENTYGLAGQWFDKYSYVMRDGLAAQYDDRGFPNVVDHPDYWWVKLGTVSAVDANGERTVDYDTGILGTDQYNTEWSYAPDELRASRVIREDRGAWSDSPTATYEGLDVTIDGTEYHNGDTISDPYHYRTFNQTTWLQYRGSDSFNGISDEQLRQIMIEQYRVDLEISRAWHYDALWECKVDLTAQEPTLGCSDWVLLRMPTISLPFFDGDGLPLMVLPVHSEGVIEETVVPKLMFGQYDFSEAVTAWQWERESDFPDLDAIWNAQARARQQSLTLVNADFPSGWWLGTLSWKCTATFDGIGSEATELTNVITV